MTLRWNQVQNSTASSGNSFYLWLLRGGMYASSSKTYKTHKFKGEKQNNQSQSDLKVALDETKIVGTKGH